MTGDEKNMAVFNDSTGDLWTVTPNTVLKEAGAIDITAHTSEGPITLTLPTISDAYLLANRIKDVAVGEAFDRATAATAIKEGDEVVGFDGNRGTVAAIHPIGQQATVRLSDGHLYYYDLVNLRPAPACPSHDGTCGDCSDAPADASGEHYAAAGQEVS